MIEHALYFLLISFATALATALIRLDGWKRISKDTIDFFVTITVGVFLLCVVVYFLEWIFVRPLL